MPFLLNFNFMCRLPRAMQHYSLHCANVLVAGSVVLAAATLWPATSHAALKCQERTANRVCTDWMPKTYTIAPGQTTDIAAPVLPGFPSPCWNWQRQFQCVEDVPILSCDSGADFTTVKNTCSLTDAAITATVTLNALTYITDATYTYRCAFGEFTSPQHLPAGADCVTLKSTTNDTTVVSASAPGNAPSTGTGTPPTTAPLSDTLVTEQQRVASYVCYSPPQTTCTDTCYASVANPATGQMEQQVVACTAPVSNCVTSSSQCTGTITQDAQGIPVVTESLGPDGRCVKTVSSQMCQNGDIPKCLTKDNCTLQSSAPSGVQANGVAMYQNQTYVCSNTTKSCAKKVAISNCVHANAWGWDNLTLKNQVGQGLGEFNQAMAKAEAIQKGMNTSDPYVFSGQPLKCHYAVGNFLNTFIILAIAAAVIVASGGAAAIGMAGGLGGGGLSTTGAVGLVQSAAVAGMNAGLISGATAATATINANLIVGAAAGAYTASQDASGSTAFGSNCCKDYVIEGSDAWYKSGACSADEVKLAVSRRKGLTVPLGEYCSKKSGFPVRQCKEKTQSYCVFDDMLALVVNQQGRAQLDALASADATTTSSTAPATLELYGAAIANPTRYEGLNNGQWVLRSNERHSQIWTWRWPGYCRTPSDQKAAFDLYNADLTAILSQQDIPPGQMTQAQALKLLSNTIDMPAFQDCADTPGLLPFMTCSKTDDSCDTARLPAGPSGASADITGTTVSDADVNWRIQQTSSFNNPGDYGVTALMSSDASFAAVSDSVNEFVTATGSCHADGNCLYQFAITDKQATGGLGARKRVKDYAQFPLYTLDQSAVWPTIDYLAPDGTLDMAAYAADPNKGRGTPLAVNNQRFLFHPNALATASATNIHQSVLLDWAFAKVPTDVNEDVYAPLVVPTSLPPATPGWYPHGDASDNSAHFYLSGGCDPNSRWCNYAAEIDLTIRRHPWGSAESPRCWGFSLEQMAALDFDKMDLSRWVNSLDMSSATNGLSADAATAMANQVTQSAQSFYSTFNSGGAMTRPGAGDVALVTNTNTLPMVSSTEDSSYTLHIAVPANWPNWFDDQPNNNPVTNVWVNWGDGSPKQSVSRSSTGRAYDGTHDYGHNPPGTYKVTVTLDTLNNAGDSTQTLTTRISITPNGGDVPTSTPLDFSGPGTSGANQGQYVPSTMPNGSSQAPDNLEQIAPGTADQFRTQGGRVSSP